MGTSSKKYFLCQNLSHKSLASQRRIGYNPIIKAPSQALTRQLPQRGSQERFIDALASPSGRGVCEADGEGEEPNKEIYYGLD